MEKFELHEVLCEPSTSETTNYHVFTGTEEECKKEIKRLKKLRGDYFTPGYIIYQSIDNIDLIKTYLDTYLLCVKPSGNVAKWIIEQLEKINAPMSYTLFGNRSVKDIHAWITKNYNYENDGA